MSRAPEKVPDPRRNRRFVDRATGGKEDGAVAVRLAATIDLS